MTPAVTDTIVGTGHRVTFETASVTDDNDDVSVASSVEDFGVNYVMGSVKRVHSNRVISVPKVYAPYRKPHRAKSLPQSPPASKLPQPWCVVALLLLLVGYSCCRWPQGSTVSVIGLLRPVAQGLGFRRSGPTSSITGSRCVGDARMARSVPTGNLSRIQRATSSSSTFACVDSGCIQDMVPMRQAFLTYTPLTACYVIITNSQRIPCAGHGTVILTLRDKTVKLCNVFHVPDIEMPLLSVRSHRGRGQGCSFLADGSGCFLTFPTFILDIDDEDDCVIPCSLATLSAKPDYSEVTQHRAYCSSHVDTLRFRAKRARGTLLCFSKGNVR